MRVYETTFILSPQADDAAFDRQIKAVSELINRHKGNVLEEDRWGIRRLAYAIKKFTQGYFTRIVFEGSNTLLKELDRFYRLEEPYIRNLTVSFEGKLKEKEADEPVAYRPQKAVPNINKEAKEITKPPVEEKPEADESTKFKPEVTAGEKPSETKPADEDSIKPDDKPEDKL